LTMLLQGLGVPAGEIRPVYGPPRAGDVQHSMACIDKARKLLGYNPKYSLSEGLQLAIKWYYENLK